MYTLADSRVCLHAHTRIGDNGIVYIVHIYVRQWDSLMGPLPNTYTYRRQWNSVHSTHICETMG